MRLLYRTTKVRIERKKCFTASSLPVEKWQNIWLEVHVYKKILHMKVLVKGAKENGPLSFPCVDSFDMVIGKQLSLWCGHAFDSPFSELWLNITEHLSIGSRTAPWIFQEGMS